MRIHQLTDPVLLKLCCNKFRCLDFTPTWACNSRCKMCSIWKRDKIHLSVDQTRNILNYFHELDLILVEGGEVSLWPYLHWMVEYYLLERSGEMLILTNGFDVNYWKIQSIYWNRVLRDVYQRVRYVVSIDGIREKHDELRGVKGAFEWASQTVDVLRRHGNKVTIQYTPFKINEDEYFRVRDFGLSKGCETIICYPSFHTRFSDALKLERADPVKLKAMYKDRVSRIGFWRRWSREMFLEKAGNREMMPCVAARQFVCVDPEGNIRPCIMSERIIGKATDKDIQLWSTEILSAWENIPEECQYINGDVCCDYLMMDSLQKNPTLILKWGLKRCFGIS